MKQYTPLSHQTTTTMTETKFEHLFIEINTVLEGMLKCKPDKFPNVRLELTPHQVPLYFKQRGNYNAGYKLCPIVIHHNQKFSELKNSNEVFAFGYWESFEEKTLEFEWNRLHRKKQVIALNKALTGLSLREQVETCVSFNLRGQKEGWLDSNKSPSQIYISHFDSENKISKSEPCSDSLTIDLHIKSLTPSDLPYLIEILNTKEYWGEEYGRVELWEACNRLIGTPEGGVLFTSKRSINKRIMPSTELLGKILNVNEKTDLDTHTDTEIVNYVPAPQGFKALIEYCRSGLRDNVLSEGRWYETTRYGKVRAGASSRFTFNLSLNERVYEVEFYGSDRGGFPKRPADYIKDLIVRESAGQSDYFMSVGDLADNLILRNLARKLDAYLKMG